MLKLLRAASSLCKVNDQSAAGNTGSLAERRQLKGIHVNIVTGKAEPMSRTSRLKKSMRNIIGKINNIKSDDSKVGASETAPAAPQNIHIKAVKANITKAANSLRRLVSKDGAIPEDREVSKNSVSSGKLAKSGLNSLVEDIY